MQSEELNEKDKDILQNFRMDIMNLKEDDGIHCRTEEEFHKIRKLFAEHGVKFDEDLFDLFENNTVVYPEGTYSDIEYAKRHKLSYFPAEKFFNNICEC